jgi:hypothetical protein
MASYWTTAADDGQIHQRFPPTTDLSDKRYISSFCLLEISLFFFYCPKVSWGSHEARKDSL